MIFDVTWLFLQLLRINQCQSSCHIRIPWKNEVDLSITHTYTRRYVYIDRGFLVVLPLFGHGLFFRRPHWFCTQNTQTHTQCHLLLKRGVCLFSIRDTPLSTWWPTNTTDGSKKLVWGAMTRICASEGDAWRPLTLILWNPRRKMCIRPSRITRFCRVL